MYILAKFNTLSLENQFYNSILPTPCWNPVLGALKGFQQCASAKKLAFAETKNLYT